MYDGKSKSMASYRNNVALLGYFPGWHPTVFSKLGIYFVKGTWRMQFYSLNRTISVTTSTNGQDSDYHL